MGDTRNIYKKLSGGDEVSITIAEEQKPIPAYSIWDDSALANRLNYGGIIISVLDEILSFVAERSPAVEKFFTAMIPSYVMGLYYFIPPIIPFLPNIRAYCRKTAQEHLHASRTEELNELKEHLQEDDRIRQVFVEHPATMKLLVQRIYDYHKNASNDKIGLIINLVYLTLHALQGLVLLTSPAAKEELERWSDLISSVINISYFFAQGLRRSHAQNNSVPKSSTSSPALYLHRGSHGSPKSPDELNSPTNESVIRATL